MIGILWKTVQEEFKLKNLHKEDPVMPDVFNCIYIKVGTINDVCNFCSSAQNLIKATMVDCFIQGSKKLKI